MGLRAVTRPGHVFELSSSHSPGPEATPEMVVARCYGSGQAPMGLDRPTPLKGGACLGPSGIASSVPLDWIEEIATVLAGSCRDQLAQDRHWFRMHPCALVGRQGAGRTHVARQIARHAGVPFIRFDLGTLDAGLHAGWSTDWPDVGWVPAPLSGIASSTCANPVVLVTGVDGAPPGACSLLASMIDRHSGRRWTHEGLRSVFDLGEVTWLVSTERGEVLHPDLYSRLVQLRVQVPVSEEGRALRAFGVALEVLADLDVDFADVAPLLNATMLRGEWADAGRHPGDVLYKMIAKQLTGSIRADAEACPR